MAGLVKIIGIGTFIYLLYGFFGENINNSIIYFVEKINGLGCLVPIQIVYLLLYILAVIIIKSFINLIK